MAKEAEEREIKRNNRPKISFILFIIFLCLQHLHKEQDCIGEAQAQYEVPETEL